METPKCCKEKLFKVVQFHELPFQDIDTYVCVPRSWIAEYPNTAKMVAVAYPNNEDPLAITDRVKNKENPCHGWQLYKAVIKYESSTFQDADNWIETQNYQRPCKTEYSEKKIKDSLLEPKRNRKLYNVSRPCFSPFKSSVSVKPYRKPHMPRTLIRPPLQSMLKKNMDTKRVNEIGNPVSGVINPPSTGGEHFQEKQSIIVPNDQLIQSTRSKIAALDDKTSPEHTLPDFIRENKSVKSDQDASSKLLHKKRSSPATQTGKQAVKRSEINTKIDGDDYKDDIADQVQSEPLKKNAKFPDKISANSPKQVAQSEFIKERSTPLLHHKHSLPELRLQDEPAKQSKEADFNSSTQLLQTLTTHVIVSRPSGTPYQNCHSKHPQSPFLTFTSATQQNFPLQEKSRGNSTEVTHNQHIPPSQDFINNTSSPPYYVTNPTTQLLHPSIKKKTSSVTENSVAKKTCFKNSTRSTSIRQDPSNQTEQVHIIDKSIVKPAPRIVQNYPKESARHLISNARTDYGPLDLSISQQSTITSAARNRLYPTQISRSSVKQSDIQHDLLMRQHHMDQIANLKSKIEQSDVGYSTEGDAHLSGTINSEFTLQSKANSFGQSTQLISQCNNPYGLLNEESMQEGLRHAVPSGSIDGIHFNSATITQNFRNIIQFPTQNLVNLSHYNYNNLQQRENPPWFQDLSDPILKCKRQDVIKTIQSPALLKTPSQSLLYAEHQDPLQSDPTRNFVDEIKPTQVNVEVQTEPLSDRSGDTPTALSPEKSNVYQHRCSQKMVVDQATEMNPVMDADHSVDEAFESSNKSTPQAKDSGCQKDVYFVKEPASPCQETDSDTETSTLEVDLDRDEYEDHSSCRVDTRSGSRPRSSQNPQMQQRIDVMQEILHMCGNFFNQMGATLYYANDLHNHLSNSNIKFAEEYKTLQDQFEKYSKMKQ